MNKLEKFAQERNRLGQTAYVNTEGLEPVRGLTPKHTTLIERINRATAGDNLNTRIRRGIDDYKKAVKKAKSTGLMDKDQPIEVWAFNINGEMEKEII